MTNHDETTAKDAVAGLAAADANRCASPAVESMLLAAFAAHRASRTSWHRWGAIAAMLVLAVGLSLIWLGRVQTGWRAASSEQRTAVAEVGDFVAWPGAETLPEFEGGALVRTTLPVTVLPMLGISPVDAPAVDGHVVADVLYGQDGQPRAVRVVNKALQP